MVFNVVVIIVGLFIASIEDIKTREVPDIFSFSLLSLGILYASLMSIINNTLIFIISSLAGIAIAAAIGAVFHYSGQWGGGDFKLIMAVGALMGVNVLNFSVFPNFILFLVNSFLAGAVIGLIYIVALAIINRKKYKKEFYASRTTKKNKLVRKAFILGIPIIIALTLIIPFGLIIKLLIVIILALSYITYYLSLFIKAVEKISMIKKISVSKLTEGDWIVNEVKLKNGQMFRSAKTGILNEDIFLLKKNNIKSVVIKEGIPFVPSFLVGYLLTLIIGNWFLWLSI